jgi:hypothetical protein
MDEAITAAAKVAYLCSKLFKGDLPPFRNMTGRI